ncbi:MAG: hypothetical protein B6A08_18555 [Sorangiineae bacterium NIC37A_2]|nr:MAG: hypothetical protein B6A08_18555 [Sorangiineae bacterium NIC37A_2]
MAGESSFRGKGEAGPEDGAAGSPREKKSHPHSFQTGMQGQGTRGGGSSWPSVLFAFHSFYEAGTKIRRVYRKST